MPRHRLAAQPAGAEYLILPHLMLTQRMCLIDLVDIEWHDKHLRQAIKQNRTTTKAADGSAPIRYERTGASAVYALTSTNQVAGLPALYYGALGHMPARGPRPDKSPDCRTQIVRTDDETYLNDGLPWPGGSVC